MRLLLDQGLARSAVSAPRGFGHDAIHAGDAGLSAATDESILDFAIADRRVIVTLDADFHSILARRGASAPSVIRIRLEGLSAAAQAAVIIETAAVAGSNLEEGAAVTVTAVASGFADCPSIQGHDELQ